MDVYAGSRRSDGDGTVLYCTVLYCTVMDVVMDVCAGSRRSGAPRARDFPNPHDGEMKSDPAEKLYETPTKKTMGLIK